MGASPQHVVKQFLETLILQADMDAIWQYVFTDDRPSIQMAIQRTHDDSNLARTRLYYSHADCDISKLEFIVRHEDAESASIVLEGKVYARYTSARFSISPERIYSGGVIYLRKEGETWLICAKPKR